MPPRPSPSLPPSALPPRLRLGGLVVLWVIGCAARRPAPSQLPAVQAIRFEGDGGLFSDTSDVNLRTAMEQTQNPAFAWVRPRHRKVSLDQDKLEADAWRIETWLAHRGYLDARFLGWEVVGVGRGRWALGLSSRPSVQVIGHLDVGPATLVRSLRFTWLDASGAEVPEEGSSSAFLRLLQREIPVQEGERLELESVNATVALVTEALQDRGYAFAKVSASVESFPEEHAAYVHIEVARGDFCRFGPARVEGEIGLPVALVTEQLDVPEGEIFQTSALARTQRRLFGLGVFSVVRVIPDLENATPVFAKKPGPDGSPVVLHQIVPVRVVLVEGLARQLRLGGGFEVAPGKLDVHGSVDFDHANVANHLVRLNLSNEVGYTSLSTLSDLTSVVEEVATSEPAPDAASSTHGPTVMSSVELVVPRIPWKRWQVSNTVSYELGVEEGYRFSTPAWSPGLSGRLGEHWTVGSSYHLVYFDYIDLTIDPSKALRRFDLNFRDPYLLSYLTQSVQYDTRDDILSPRSGLYGIYDVSEAGGPFGGFYDYVRFRADQRVYFSLVRIPGLNRLLNASRGALAFRLGGGLLRPYGEGASAAAPVAERLRLGGSTTVRGWRQDHLGPYICDLTALEEVGLPEGSPYTLESCPPGRLGSEQPTEEIQPIGGLASLFTSAELRLYGAGGFGGALFVDAGMAWEDLAAAWPPVLLPSVGAGLRYKSPIGPVRLDLARRLDDEPMFSLEPRYGVHFSVSEAF